MNCLVAVSRVGKKLVEQVADEAGLDAVEIVLAIAAEANQAGHAQQGQVVTDGRLLLAEHFAKGGHVHLSILRQTQEDLESRFIGEQLEDLGQSVQSVW